jgi:integrase/recombinase XerD
MDANTQILDLLTKFNQLYINAKKSQNLSQNSISLYYRVLERFYDFCADELANNEYLSVNGINKYFLGNYIFSLHKNKISRTSQKTHLTVIKNYLHFIADSDIPEFGFLKVNLSGYKIKTDSKVKDSFSQDDQNRIIAYTQRLDKEKSYLANRNSLLLKMLLFTGVRISELINIKWSDIEEYYDETHGHIITILVNGKGNKQRYTYLLQDEVEDNLEYIHQSQRDNGYLFETAHGNPCNRSNLFVTVKKLLAKAGVAKSGLHIFRHTFARNLVSNNHNLATIKELLGHSNISVTAQFYAVSNENAKKAALFKR